MQTAIRLTEKNQETWLKPDNPPNDVYAFGRTKSHCSNKQTRNKHSKPIEILRPDKEIIGTATSHLRWERCIYFLPEQPSFLLFYSIFQMIQKSSLKPAEILRSFSCLLFVSLMVALYWSLLALPSFWNGLLFLDEKFLAFDRRLCLLIGNMN